MNDLDKASRYLAKRDSGGFLRWLVTNPGLRFHAWIDARRLALPNQPRRTAPDAKWSESKGVAELDRLTSEAPPDRAKKLLTDAFLLSGLRVRRNVAARIFRGVRVMHESDTYLAILDEGQERHAKKAVLLVGEERLGPPDESVRARLDGITDLERLDRMLRRAVTAARWEEILDIP